MPQRVTIIHTGPVLIEPLTNLFREMLPGVDLAHILDDSLLKDARRVGHVDQSVLRRMVAYMLAAEAGGADVILNACSSVGETVDVARQLVKVPIVKIDEAMAEMAVGRAKQIGVVATVPTTLDPTCRLVERKAAEAGKSVNIKRHLCEGAYDVLMAGDPQKHDQMVLEGIRQLAATTELVVLAQGSIARLVPQLEEKTAARVLSSPRGGVQRVKEVLERQRGRA